MLRVIIESPLSAPTREGIERNKDYAKKAVLHSLRKGESPYASHLFFDQDGILDDLEPAERELGIQAGFAWGEVADLVAVYADFGISHGMLLGIERAKSAEQKVEYRYLYPRGEEVKL